MLVVHGRWSGGLLLWAEDSAAPPPKRRPGRRPATGDHPFAADAQALLDVVGGDPQTITVTLPSTGGVPAGSPQLPGEDTGAPALRDWRVPAVRLDPDDALALLVHELPEPFVAAAALRWWAGVAALADGLAGRGRVLPSVDGDRAVWRPLLTGADATHARDLLRAMPPPARGDEPAADLTAALDELTDAAVRARLGTPVAGRRIGGDAAARWRAALTGPQRRFDATPAELARLSEDLRTWQADAAGGPVRARFRLLEPRDGTDPWRLDFALQATDEPSLVVGAGDVWHSPDAAGALARHVAAPQEALLAELGRAHRLFPGLEPALRTARPAYLELDAGQAYDFLTGTAQSLAAAGFGVLLPGWWSKPKARLGVRLAASTPGQPGTVAGNARFGQQALVDYRWEVAIGDEPLTEEELQALAALQQPLVRFRGQWVQLDQARLRNGLKLLQEQGSGTASVGDVLQVLSLGTGPGGLPVLDVDADGWLGDLIAPDADARVTEIDTPAGFHGTLRPYQRRGLSWLAFLQRLGLGAVLADDMGLGKTVQLLALIAGDDPGEPTLLVAPMSLIGNWQREAARFAPDLRVHVHHGAERVRGEAFREAVAASDLVLTTYALAARDAAELGETGWRRIVLDEAQAVKNAATRAAVAVRSLPARHRIAVTGTPVENRLADLWSLMEFANPGLLGTASAFKERYAKPIERHSDADAARRLRTITQPFVLRRLKTDRSIITDLPEKLEMEVLCTLTREQATLYQAVVDDMLARIAEAEADPDGGMQRRGLVLATMTKLKQVCNHPAQLLRDGSALAGRSGKLARLEETVEEILAGGERALLFTQYAEWGAMLRAHLSARFGREVAYLHGGVPKPQRDELVARFQAADAASPSLFVLSLKAGGTGLTLTAANHVVHVDRWWNPAVEDQATDRAFRIGQRRAVQVRKLVCAGTVEERIAAMIREKRGLAASIVGTGEGWLTELSTDQLRELLTLEAGAVVE